MPGLFSWIRGFFYRSRTAGHQSEHLGPACSTSGDRSKQGREAGRALASALQQHLFCWLLDTRPQNLSAGVENSDALVEELGRRLLAGALGELPRQPMSLPMLLSALSDDGTTRKDLGSIILRDPALTDQLLKVANSPFFRPGKNTIETVDQAVFMLGIEGIRSVVSAALMRPMISARNSEEAGFTARTWRWGMACARAAETSARLQGKDPSLYFMAGLLPALAYITLYRETQNLSKVDGRQPKAARLHQVLTRYQWPLARLIARTWGLSNRYQNLLHGPEDSVNRNNSALLDGATIGTREILRHARQRNLGDEDLPALVQMDASQIRQVQAALKPMLEESENAAKEDA